MSDENNDGLQFLKSPWVTAVSLLLGFAGIAFAVYTHIDSQKEKSLSIIVDQDVTSIIDSKKVKGSNFSVVDKSGKKIEGDISAFKIRIINDGDLPIRKKDILDPIRIYFRSFSAYTFFEHSIETSRKISVTKPLIDLKQVLDVDRDAKEAVFSVDFKILEKGDSISITVIFQGSKIPERYIAGSIEGIPRISTNKTDPKKSNRVALLTAYFALIILVILQITLFFYGRSRAHPRERDKIAKYRSIVATAVGMLFLFIIYLMLFLKS